MKFFYKRRFVKRILFGTLVAALIVFAVIFIVVPVIYRYSYVFQRNLLFLNFVTIPVDFENPQSVGLLGSQNFYVETNDSVKIGLWHILPSKLVLSATLNSKNGTEAYLNHGEPIFLYLHGNSGNRGTSHRVQLYRLLQQNNFHVVAFDYRSYGDSARVEPSEAGVVNDSKSVFHWVRKRAGDSKIYLWGHSLGTGISSHLLSILESEKENVAGLILESPFNNLADEIRNYPLAKFFKYLPWFDYFFIEPTYKNGLRFESDVHLSKVKTPIMILHAEDDIVVPFKLGIKLYETIRKARKLTGYNSTLTMKRFERRLGFGHKYIYKAKDLTSYIQEFMADSTRDNN